MFRVTADFLKALRKAPEVSMYAKAGKVATIRLMRRDDILKEGRWDWEENYEVGSGEWYDFPEFYFHSNYKSTSGWEIFSKVLKVGDELRFHPRNNNNQYLESCTARLLDDHGRVRETYEGMHHDQLTVTVYRKDKLYLQDVVLEDSVCPNNSARSIRS